jgi:hypothetical protein
MILNGGNILSTNFLRGSSATPSFVVLVISTKRGALFRKYK